MMRRLLILAILLGCASLAHASYTNCTSTAYSGYTCDSVTFGSASSVSLPSASVTGVTAGDLVTGSINTLSTSGTLAIGTISGCFSGSPTEYGGAVNLTNGNAIVFSFVATSTATCTIPLTNSASTTIVWNIADITGANTVDVSANLASLSITSGTTENCPAVTTNLSGDFVLCYMIDAGNNDVTYTPQSPFTNLTAGASNTSYGIQGDVQSTAGAITPQFKYSHTGTVGVATIAFYKALTPPTFSLAGGTYNSGLPKTTTLASAASTVDCYTTCSTSGCTPATPTAPTAGTCTVGTQTSSNSTSLTIPPGYTTYSAIATESGQNNSAVTTSPQYDIVPTLSSWNGATVGPTQGNISKMNGSYINPYTGYIDSISGLTSPFTALTVDTFIDFHGGTSGSAPTVTTLNTSTYGGAGGYSYNVSGLGPGVDYTNALSIGALPRPINIAGTVYDQTGSLGMLCTTATTGTNCANLPVSFTTSTGTASLGYWYESTCSGASQECGAHGGLAGGVDYVVLHNNGQGGNCPYNGLFLETKGGNSLPCLSYSANTLYRINVQMNTGETPFTATFTGSSASISATQTLVANQAVMLSTTGTFPGGYSSNGIVWTGTYTSGVTAVGSTGQTCELSGFNGGGSGAVAILTLTGTNTIASGSALSFAPPSPSGIVTSYGSGYTSQPTTATASAGTASSCSGTATISTTLATGNLLYVIPNGLSGSAFELSAAQNGTAITATSAGTGTQTVNVMEQMTICSGNPPTFLGYLFSPAYTTAQTPNNIWIVGSAEEPTVAGFLFYEYGYVQNLSGLFSKTECIL